MLSKEVRNQIESFLFRKWPERSLMLHYIASVLRVPLQKKKLSYGEKMFVLLQIGCIFGEEVHAADVMRRLDTLSVGRDKLFSD